MSISYILDAKDPETINLIPQWVAEDRAQGANAYSDAPGEYWADAGSWLAEVFEARLQAAHDNIDWEVTLINKNHILPGEGEDDIEFATYTYTIRAGETTRETNVREN